MESSSDSENSQHNRRRRILRKLKKNKGKASRFRSFFTDDAFPFVKALLIGSRCTAFQLSCATSERHFFQLAQWRLYLLNQGFERDFDSLMFGAAAQLRPNRRRNDPPITQEEQNRLEIALGGGAPVEEQQQQQVEQQDVQVQGNQGAAGNEQGGNQNAAAGAANGQANGLANINNNNNTVAQPQNRRHNANTTINNRIASRQPFRFMDHFVLFTVIEIMQEEEHETNIRESCI
ncbi:MAG: hypothetical protein EZS28_047202, partial [Streblomastix strix]